MGSVSSETGIGVYREPRMVSTETDSADHLFGVASDYLLRARLRSSFENAASRRPDCRS